MSQFKVIKSVCIRCMDTTRIPLHASYGSLDPVPWNPTDEERWARGKVQCPQAAGELKPTRQFCLRYKEVDAMNDGKVFVWDEKQKS